MSKNPPIRPGLIIHDELMKGPRGISEMHRTYKDKVYELNSLRSRADRVHAANYWSFARECQFAKSLGLIEEDHQAPITNKRVPQSDRLLAIRGGKVVPSTRVIYRLTGEGIDSAAWLNLSGAAKETLGWG